MESMATVESQAHDSLVSITPARSGLVGIARLAAESPKTRERAEVEYFSLASRSALNRESSGRMPFAWTLNPYRGCEFGCKYCYARYTHEFMEMWDGQDFERKIYAKASAPELLRAELRAAKDKGQPIAIGTVTDPYQPAEKQFETTRRMLEVFAEFEGLNLSLITKSVLILRDIELLQALTAKHRFSAHITVTTLDERLARLLEPKAPPPAKRLEALSALAAAGIFVTVSAAPILPGLNDDPRALDALVRAAARAGAKAIHGNVLFLMPSAMKQFMPFLEAEFPRLVTRYRKLYARSAYLRGEYKERMVTLMRELRSRYHLDNEWQPPAPLVRRQMALPFAPS
ncbi:MAG TPA: radical SAM protein [Terriglobia bacterium]|nr:radical SAM protein [Terriglobia bacterium]